MTPIDGDTDTADEPARLMHSIAARLKALRAERGWSASALARAAGVAKSTLTQLVQGQGNPGIETLWALGGALGVPFAELIAPPTPAVHVVRAHEGLTTRAEAADLSATLCTRMDSGRRQSLYRLHVAAGATRDSSAHIPGTVEHLIVTQGRLIAGPVDALVTLEAGDYMRYPGDVAHRYSAWDDQDVEALLIMAYS